MNSNPKTTMPCTEPKAIDIPACIARITPGNDYAFVRGSGETSDYEALEWRGKDPKPTRAQIEAVWQQLLAEQAAAEQG